MYTHSNANNYVVNKNYIVRSILYIKLCNLQDWANPRRSVWGIYYQHSIDYTRYQCQLALCMGEVQVAYRIVYKMSIESITVQKLNETKNTSKQYKDE